MPPTDRAAERSLLGKNDDGRRFLTAAIGEVGGAPAREPPLTAPFLDTITPEVVEAAREALLIGR